MSEGLSQHQVEQIVERSVHQTLSSLGLDVTTNSERKYIQADFAYMRRQRRGAEKIADAAKRSIVGAAVAGLLYAIWYGVKSALQLHGGP